MISLGSGSERVQSMCREGVDNSGSESLGLRCLIAGWTKKQKEHSGREWGQALPIRPTSSNPFLSVRLLKLPQSAETELPARE